MKQSNLSKWLKFITIAVGIMGAIVFFLIIPSEGRMIAKANPEYSYCYWIWLSFIWVMAVPCYLVLVYFWKICNQIERDNSFSLENAKSLTRISQLAIFDTIICFFGNVILLLMGISHPVVIILFLFVIFAGVAVAVVSAALSHLVEKASTIQEENNLTI